MNYSEFLANQDIRQPPPKKPRSISTFTHKSYSKNQIPYTQKYNPNSSFSTSTKQSTRYSKLQLNQKLTPTKPQQKVKHTPKKDKIQHQKSLISFLQTTLNQAFKNSPILEKTNQNSPQKSQNRSFMSPDKLNINSKKPSQTSDQNSPIIPQQKSRIYSQQQENMLEKSQDLSNINVKNSQILHKIHKIQQNSNKTSPISGKLGPRNKINNIQNSPTSNINININKSQIFRKNIENKPKKIKNPVMMVCMIDKKYKEQQKLNQNLVVKNLKQNAENYIKNQERTDQEILENFLNQQKNQNKLINILQESVHKQKFQKIKNQPKNFSKLIIKTPQRLQERVRSMTNGPFLSQNFTKIPGNQTRSSLKSAFRMQNTQIRAENNVSNTSNYQKKIREYNQNQENLSNLFQNDNLQSIQQQEKQVNIKTDNLQQEKEENEQILTKLRSNTITLSPLAYSSSPSKNQTIEQIKKQEQFSHNIGYQSNSIYGQCIMQVQSKNKEQARKLTRLQVKRIESRSKSPLETLTSNINLYRSRNQSSQFRSVKNNQTNKICRQSMYII